MALRAPGLAAARGARGASDRPAAMTDGVHRTRTTLSAAGTSLPAGLVAPPVAASSAPHLSGRGGNAAAAGTQQPAHLPGETAERPVKGPKIAPLPDNFPQHTLPERAVLVAKRL